MKEKSTIVRHSLSQVRAMRERSGDKTSPDGTEAGSLGADFWNSARVVMPGARFPFTFASTMMWWNGSRPMEKGHLTRMNAVLKAYVDGQKC